MSDTTTYLAEILENIQKQNKLLTFQNKLIIKSMEQNIEIFRADSTAMFKDTSASQLKRQIQELEKESRSI